MASFLLHSKSPRPLAGVVGLGLVLGLTGCPGSATSRKISATRTTTHPAKVVKLEVTSADRLPSLMGMGGHGSGAHEGAESPLSFDLPAGWTSKPDPTGMRLASFGLEKSPDADCSITLSGGDLVGNVNRWRSQMGLPPADESAVGSLPRRPLLGGTAVLIELDGSFKGMGPAALAHAGYKLLGVILPLERESVFVKFTGPAAVVDSERKSFDVLLDSIRPTEDPNPPDPHSPERPAPDSPQGKIPNDSIHKGLGGGGGGAGMVGPLHDPTPADSQESPLQYTTPEGWALGPARPMRLVTFNVGQIECYVTVLGAGAGSLAANINRWRGQVNQPPLDDAAIAALPKVKVLGQDVALVEAKGEFAGMQGTGPSASRPSSVLMGVIVSEPTRTVTVKLVGPESEVAAERERFLAFLGSLR